MPSNIILCFDGTSNEFGENNTNVVRLIQVLDRDAQRLYYDPGVGTLPEPGWKTRIGKKASEITGLAIGAGLLGKVEAAYRYLMDHWEHGSNVYVFGFSRGAYTARVLAGMLHSLGLLSRGNHDLVPYVMRLFQSLRGRQSRDEQSAYWRLLNGFRWTFARAAGDDVRRFPLHFMGLWDTVSSVGWVWEPRNFPFTAGNPSVTTVRHAVSIDERRAFFKQNLVNPQAEQDWQERWFPGVHADVGGGYPERDGGLWRPSWEWILAEAKRNGLTIDDDRLAKVRNHHLTSPNQPWHESAHESLHGWWWLAEYYPKRRQQRDGRTILKMNRGQSRFIPDGALIDQSAMQRVRESKYRPQNFSTTFVDCVLSLPQIPDVLPYQTGP